MAYIGWERRNAIIEITRPQKGRVLKLFDSQNRFGRKSVKW
jgi:hypothetical protein